MKTEYDKARQAIEERIALQQKAIDSVMKEAPGPGRWRAAADLVVKMHPAVKKTHLEVVKDCAETRQYLLTPFGTSGDKNSSLRNYMRMPGAVKNAIERADPLAFKKDSNAALMRKTFPEYCTSEIY